jgi:hypothetical protein
MGSPNAILGNTSCLINAQNSGLGATAGGNLLWVLQIGFSAANFGGIHSVYAEAINAQNATSNFQKMGTWTVTGALPSVVGMTPSAGAGTVSNFNVQFSDPQGQTNITDLFLLFSNTGQGIAGNNACVAWLRRTTGQLYLLNDTGTGWGSPVTMGSPSAILGNTSCLINAQNSGLGATAGGNLLWVLQIGFSQANFAGSHTVYAQAVNAQNATSNFQTVGTWTVTGALPTVVGMTPSSGAGTVSNFNVQFSDPQGQTNITDLFLLFSNTSQGIGGNNACVAWLRRTTGQLYLLNDTGTGWGSPVTMGSPNAILGNTSCLINAQNSGLGATAGGNLLWVLQIGFGLGTFGGSHTVYAQAVNAQNATSNFQTVGSWVVQ